MKSACLHICAVVCIQWWSAAEIRTINHRCIGGQQKDSQKIFQKYHFVFKLWIIMKRKTRLQAVVKFAIILFLSSFIADKWLRNKCTNKVQKSSEVGGFKIATNAFLNVSGKIF